MVMGNSIQRIKMHALNFLEDDNQWESIMLHRNTEPITNGVYKKCNTCKKCGRQ